jgi:glycerol-3-phosphate responsive antiterminator
MEETVESLKQRIVFLEMELRSAREAIKQLTNENEKLMIDLHFFDRKGKQ